MTEVEQVLKILSKAIVRETAAFNYYYRQSEGDFVPAGVKGLLTRLAEEERTHRRLLMNEYVAIEKGWNEDWDEERGSVLSYPIPEDPVIRDIEVSPCLEAKSISLPAALLGGDNTITSVIKDKENSVAGTFITLYDVMGHGIETTEINGLANKILGEYMDDARASKNESEALLPRNVVKNLNREMSAKYEGQGVFLTMISALFHMDKNEVTYTIAGHEPPFVLRRNGDIESLLDTQLVVGIDGEFPYRQVTVPFNEGDSYCIFSDGIIEAKDPDGEMFGRERVAEYLKGKQGVPPGEVIRGLMKALKDFTGEVPMDDEVSIVVVSARENKE